MCRTACVCGIEGADGRDRASTPCHIDVLSGAVDFIFFVGIKTIAQLLKYAATLNNVIQERKRN